MKKIKKIVMNYTNSIDLDDNFDLGEMLLEKVDMKKIKLKSDILKVLYDIKMVSEFQNSLMYN